MKIQPVEIESQEQTFEDFYMNMVQMQVNIVDSNVIIAELGRATGKTEGVMTPRILRVANSMPGELGFLVHKTYAALLANVWPNIAASFARPIDGGRRFMLEEGIDYVVGASKLPSHFKKPRYPIAYPKHSIVFRNGFHLQMVSSDQPESVAGRSGVHAFIEEMKHNKGEKLKTRLFPSLRGSSAEIRKSPYYQGITGVSDTARVDLGEDNWFEAYEKNMKQELIDEIATVSLHLNGFMYEQFKINQLQRQEKNPIAIEKLRIALEKAKRQIAIWKPRLDDMRRNASYYIRASSFANKDILGPKFFKTQIESMDIDEFLVAICAVRRQSVVNKFFINYNPKVHTFSDSYKYESILKLDLKDHFSLTSKYLKYYNPKDELILGYDPGHFSSLVALQERKNGEEVRVIKEFTVYFPFQQPELARDVYNFFGEQSVNKRILLYHDRAGNKRKEDYEQITTDARILKKELESYGFSVDLMNEGQATVYYWQQFKLLSLIFGDRCNYLPTCLIDENECKNLCSAILLSPRKNTDGRIELDKSSEVKVPLRHQAGLTTQLPSALIYALHGRYFDSLPAEYSDIPDNIPDNCIV